MVVLQLADAEGYSLVVNAIAMTSRSDRIQPEFVRFAVFVSTRWDNANTLTFQIAEVAARNVEYEVTDSADSTFRNQLVITQTFTDVGIVGTVNINRNVSLSLSFSHRLAFFL